MQSQTFPSLPLDGHPRPGRMAVEAAAGLGLLCALLVWGSPPVALLLGMGFSVALGAARRIPWEKHAGKLLQASVVLLGFSMDLPTVLTLGLHGSAFALVSIAATLGIGVLLTRRLRIARTTGLLISIGTAICGGSAIAAASSVLAATEAEVAVAIGSVFLMNAAALYAFPLVGHWIGLSQGQFGLWAGIAIHDVSSVVGAGQAYGPTALATATAVKLARSLWIVPVTLGLAAVRRKTGATGRGPRWSAFPWFILLFLAASLARSYLPGVAAAAGFAAGLSRHGMVAVLFLIGTSLSIGALKRVGWRPLALGLALWILVSAGSLYAVIHLPAGT